MNFYVAAASRSRDETPPTEVGGLRMKRARSVDFESMRPREPPA